MSWKPETRPEHIKTFGDYTLTPERDGNRTAHLINLGDRKIRVLPDADTTGQKRATVCRRALEQIAALNGVSGDVIETYLVGALAREGLSWEYVAGDLRDVTIEEWLEHYFEADATDPRILLRDLDDDGWEIVRKDET